MVFKARTFHQTTPQAEIDDPTRSRLEADVADALARAGTLDASRIVITASNGRITLDGFVGMHPEIDTAGEVVSRVKGVDAIDNRLMVEAGTG